MQASIATALRAGAGGPDLVGEGELLARLRVHLFARGWSDQSANDAAAKLQYFGPSAACRAPEGYGEAPADSQG